MNALANDQSSPAILDIFKRELAAELSAQRGEIQKAVSELQTLIDTQIPDQGDKCWYLQEMARYSFRSSKVESNRLQVAAHRGNRYLMKPRTGVEFTPLQAVSQKQVESIMAWIK